MKKQGPIKLRNVQVTPVFREKPDIKKLGRALIAAAMRIAEIKKAEELAHTNGTDKHGTG